jgi:hypothetical protein
MGQRLLANAPARGVQKLHKRPRYVAWFIPLDSLCCVRHSPKNPYTSYTGKMLRRQADAAHKRLGGRTHASIKNQKQRPPLQTNFPKSGVDALFLQENRKRGEDKATLRISDAVEERLLPPLIVIDAAEELQRWQDPASLNTLLRFFVGITSERRQAHVVLVSSDPKMQSWLEESERLCAFRSGCVSAVLILMAC